MGSPKTKQLGNHMKKILNFFIDILNFFINILNFILDTLKDGIFGNPYVKKYFLKYVSKYFSWIFVLFLIGVWFYDDYTERGVLHTKFPNGVTFYADWHKRPFSDYGEYSSKQYGTYRYPDGEERRGRWIYRNEYGYKVGYKEVEYPTQGTFIYPNGKKYEGGWKNGQRHGHGTFSYPNGDKYEGGWKNGQRHGHGKITHPDGYEFEGEFKDGLENGQGTASYPRDTTDMGNKKEDTIKYVGEWKDGKYHGQGTLTRGGFYGSKRVGEWKYGEFMNGKVYDKDGGIEYKVVNGKKIIP